jgi:hypothetical protein
VANRISLPWQIENTPREVNHGRMSTAGEQKTGIAVAVAPARGGLLFRPPAVGRWQLAIIHSPLILHFTFLN